MNCDYRELIAELLPLLTDDKTLRRVWKILSHAYDTQIGRPRAGTPRESISPANTAE